MNRLNHETNLDYPVIMKPRRSLYACIPRRSLGTRGSRKSERQNVGQGTVEYRSVESLRSVFFRVIRIGKMPSFDIRHSLIDIRYSFSPSFPGSAWECIPEGSAFLRVSPYRSRDAQTESRRGLSPLHHSRMGKAKRAHHLDNANYKNIG